jgi:Cu+-exporting ATPase
MRVDPQAAKGGKASFEGRDYFFCNPKCKSKFEANPLFYLEKSGTPIPFSAVEAERIYICPMHPEVRQKGPGSCPQCGMALEPEEISLEEEVNTELVDFTKRLEVSAALAVPLLFFSMSDLIPGQPVQMNLPHWFYAGIQFLLATPVVVWAGQPFFERGWSSIKSKNFNMFTLIALGTGVAYAFSVAATIFPGFFPANLHVHGGQVPLYYEAAAVIITPISSSTPSAPRRRADFADNPRRTRIAFPALRRARSSKTWPKKIRVMITAAAS